MAEEALQIDFQPQPRGIAVVTSAPISSIAENGNYSAFQDLVDGYASSFAKVHVFSPSGEAVVNPIKGHRVYWHRGPRWALATTGLLWSVLSNRRELRDIELVRSFGSVAGVAGRMLAKFSSSPHVSSFDDLVGNSWRERTGWKSIPTKITNRLGLLKADMLAATLDWELDCLSETGYNRNLLLGKTGMATDIYTPVDITDPNRHPVVLWAGDVSGEDSIKLIEESAVATKSMIDNVEFIVIAHGNSAERMKADVLERDLPITVATLDEVEPLVDLIDRTWACVTVPSRGFPHGLAMFAVSAGVPLISLGDLEERNGFKNHLNYIGVEPGNHVAVAYGLQLLRRWTTWSLRIGSAGQKLIQDQFSTKSVSLKEGVQLAKFTRNEQLGTDSPVQHKVQRPYVSPAGIEFPESAEDAGVVAGKDESSAVSDQYSSSGFDLVAAALAEMSGASSSNSEPVDSFVPKTDLDQDVISALSAASDPEPVVEPVPVAKASGELDHDAISALFAAGDQDQEPASDEESTLEIVAVTTDELNQDSIPLVVEAATNPAESELTIEELLEEAMPEVKLIQFGTGGKSEEIEEEQDLEEFDSAEIDSGLIASILEGKDVDPAA